MERITLLLNGKFTIWYHIICPFIANFYSARHRKPPNLWMRFIQFSLKKSLVTFFIEVCKYVCTYHHMIILFRYEKLFESTRRTIFVQKNHPFLVDKSMTWLERTIIVHKLSYIDQKMCASLSEQKWEEKSFT